MFQLAMLITFGITFVFKSFFVMYFHFEVNQILELHSVSTDIHLSNEYEIRSMDISYFNIIHERS